MVFSSIIFLGFFLPIAFGLYLLAPARYKNAVLAFVSIIFYAWGEPRFVFLMLLSVAFNYYAAQWQHRSTRPAWVLAAAVSVNLLLLGVFKYANFFVDNLNVVLSGLSMDPWVIWTIPLPIGISFYTFHAISYLIDIRRQNAKPCQSIVDYSLYILFFPQLIAGPIVRYKDISEQLIRREISLSGLNEGIQRFTMGLAKKVLIANQLALVADAAFNAPAQTLDGGAAWLGLLCYTLQIYFDFSGYSDMAIGLARMFGFRFPENFHYPYAATSIQDFWRRWHMSLSTWFRDYVYVPLGGNRGGAVRTLVNLWLVFLLTGIWHGASWSFVIWGALHGLFLSIEKGLANVSGVRLPLLIRRIYVWAVVMLAWVFFRCESAAQAGDYLAALTRPWTPQAWLQSSTSLGPTQLASLLLVSCVLSLAFYPWLRARLAGIWQWLQDRDLDGALRALLIMVALLLCLMSIALGQYNPFIYFRF